MKVRGVVIEADDWALFSCGSELALDPPPPSSFVTLNRFFFLKTRQTTHPSSYASKKSGYKFSF